MMLEKNKIKKESLPSLLAHNLGIEYALHVSSEKKKELGQFFTPLPIANLMASYASFSNRSVKILDPGCGTLILSCCVIETLILKNPELKTIELVAYETDLQVINSTKKVLEYLNNWLVGKGISFSYILHEDDFILSNSESLRTNTPSLFDIIISNPPYFKMSKDDPRVLASNELISGQPNIYALFMGVASRMLVKGGEMIFITPRSFASGNYFRAFRTFFFKTVQLEKVHLFDSRKDAFQKDKVLQETIITKAVNTSVSNNAQVALSSCQGLFDIQTPSIKYYPIHKLVNLDTAEKIIHLPTSDKDESVLLLVNEWNNTLADYDIHISTGKVVAFRSLQYIQEIYSSETILSPLFWLHNVGKMVLEWPIEVRGKGQYILDILDSKNILIPNRNYIFLRRFSTKDDKSRLIAAPYFCNHTTAENIGVENKVNYIYRKKGHLDRSEVAGLCGLLNSSLFDTYFQIFNGNVNVSATELREMKIPKLDEIKTIGNKIILSNDYSMNNVNCIVNEYFKMQITLS